MTNAPTPAQWATDNGYSPIPLRPDTKRPARKGWHVLTFPPASWRPGELTGLRTGLQPDGSFLTVLDYDTNAAYHVQTLLASLARATVACLFLTASTTGRGRHVYLRTARPVRGTWLRGPDGEKIGDVKGTGGQAVFPTRDRWIAGDLADVPMLADGELDAILAAIGYQDAPQAPTSSIIDWTIVSTYMPRLDALTRRIRPNTPTHKALHGERPDDRSRARFSLACDLRRFYGFPDEELAALLVGYADWGTLQEKGSRWFYDDVARCVAGANARHPDIRTTPTRALAAPAAPAAAPQDAKPRTRARDDRPTKIDLAGYLVWLAERADAGLVMMNRTEVAEALGISYSTAKRLDYAARDAGKLLPRHMSADRHGSWVELRPVADDDQTKNSTTLADDDQTPQGITKPQNAIPHTYARKGSTHPPDFTPLVVPPAALVVAPVAPVVVVPPAAAAVGACVPPQTPLASDTAAGTPPPPPLRDLVYALAATNEGRRAQTIRRMVRDAFPTASWSDAAIDWTIRDVRRQERFDRLLADAAAMPMGELQRAIRSTAGRIADAYHRGTKGGIFWTFRLNVLERERDRRVVAGRAHIAAQPLPVLVDVLNDAAAAAARPPRAPRNAMQIRAMQHRLLTLGDLRS